MALNMLTSCCQSAVVPPTPNGGWGGSGSAFRKQMVRSPDPAGFVTGPSEAPLKDSCSTARVQLPPEELQSQQLPRGRQGGGPTKLNHSCNVIKTHPEGTNSLLMMWSASAKAASPQLLCRMKQRRREGSSPPK